MAFDTVQIVGVVATVKRLGLVVGDVPVIYLPHAQFAYRAIAPMLELRTTGDPMRAAGVLRRVLANIDPNVPTFDVKAESERLMQSIGTTRFATPPPAANRQTRTTAAQMRGRCLRDRIQLSSDNSGGSKKGPLKGCC
jgi:hypothetical protein